MSEVRGVPSNIDVIRNIFLDAQQAVIRYSDFKLLLDYLENTPVEFRSVAFEAAAAALAVNDFENNSELNQWKAFKELTLNHEAQVHVGLGWGMAQVRLTDFSFINTIVPLMQARVFDGYGYYDGMVRQRQHVINKIIPDHIPLELLAAYNQGIGRSLWYLSEGSINKLSNLLNGFASPRLIGLWRGIGVASAYVGGCSAQTLSNLCTLADSYQPQLASGTFLAACARLIAKSPLAETQTACEQLCKLSPAEVLLLNSKILESINLSAGDAYFIFLDKVEKELSIH